MSTDNIQQAPVSLVTARFSEWLTWQLPFGLDGKKWWQHRGPSVTERTNLLGLGCWVTLEGLQAKPELNGLTGEVIEKEPSPGRVHLADGNTKDYALKHENLRTFPDSETVMAVRLGAKKEGRRFATYK